MTPDGTFILSCDDPDDLPSAKRFVDLMYAVGVEFAHMVIFGGRQDTPSALEEIAFQFRDARLQDFGFPPEADRTALFEPLDVEALRARLVTTEALPADALAAEGRTLAMVLSRTQGGAFFWQALRGLVESEAAGLVQQVLNVVNRVLAARSRDLFEEGAWEDAARHALALLSVGLEDLAGGDPARGTDVLRKAWPVELYRAGLELVRPAHVTARRIVSDLGGMARLDLFDRPAAAALRAALAFPPLFWEGLTDPGADNTRDFRTAAEARAEVQAVRDAFAILGFARGVLGFRADAPAAAGQTFANVFATAWAHLVLSGEPGLAPLAADDLVALRAAAFTRGHVRVALRRQAKALAGRAMPTGRAAVEAFLDRAIDAVEEAIGGLAPGTAIDVRYVGDCLLLRQDVGRQTSDV